MILSPQQDAALRAVAKWRRAQSRQVFRLFGYAGTGKTTLARHFAEGVDGEVMFAAFTGKAARVMRSKGCRDASTIHHLIYRLIEQDESHRPRFTLDLASRARSASLIVIDECSMVDEAIGRDLLKFGVPILVLGDPAQLPPINGCGYFTAVEPDVMLTEVHRQARDNPIVHMATIVREGGRLAVGDYGASRVISVNALAPGYAADQVLVGRNRTRRNINSGQRARRGLHGAYPLVGDKLVCLRNDHAIGLLNGSLWGVKQLIEASSDAAISLRVEPEDGGDAIKVETHAKLFDGRASELSNWDRRQYTEFDFGYALTVHEAQGSQWSNVALFDESACFRENHACWLYTGITRATTQITVVIK